MEVLAFLDELFTSFDKVAVEFGVEKIKTIGDAYMAVCGLPKPNVNHAQVMGYSVALMSITSGMGRKLNRVSGCTVALLLQG